MTQKLGKRELNKAKKRAEIVGIASEMFFSLGYAATSMSSIADTLGGSKATLWGHFSSKEDLFAAVIDAQVAIFSRDVDELLTSQTFSIPATRNAFLRLIDCLMLKNSILLNRLITSEGERFPEIKELFYSRGPARIRAEMAHFFSTHFSDEDSVRLTQVIISTALGYRSNLLLDPAKTEKADHEVFVDTVLSYIAWPQPKGADTVFACQHH